MASYKYLVKDHEGFEYKLKPDWEIYKGKDSLSINVLSALTLNFDFDYIWRSFSNWEVNQGGYPNLEDNRDGWLYEEAEKINLITYEVDEVRCAVCNAVEDFELELVNGYDAKKYKPTKAETYLKSKMCLGKDNAFIATIKLPFYYHNYKKLEKKYGRALRLVKQKIKIEDFISWLDSQGISCYPKELKALIFNGEEQKKYFDSLGQKRQQQINLIHRVIKEHGYTGAGNGEKKEIWKKCHMLEPNLITDSFGTFQKIWADANSSGKTF